MKRVSSVRFAAGYGPELFLVDLSDAGFKKALLAGEVVLKGGVDEPAVAVSDSHTYSICSVESSNQLLLVAPEPGAESVRFDGEIIIEGHAGSRVFEPFKIHPRLASLPDLMRPASISSSDISSKRMRGMEFSNLLSRVQASAGELRAELERMGAWEDEDGWRVLEPGLCRRAFSSVLDCIAMKRMDLSKALDEDSIAAEVVELPRFVISAVIRFYSKPGEFGFLDLDRVAVFYAEQIFRVTPKLALKDLIAEWDAALPVGVTLNPDKHLRGLAIVDKGMVEYLDVAVLPKDIKGRLNRLFTVRPQWTRNELAPYLEDIADDLNSFLAKHCKASTRPSDSARVYSSKQALVR